MTTPDAAQTLSLQLISPAFRDGTSIPPQYTCKGAGASPPLNILGVPTETKSMALIMHDPDAVGGDFVHWILWDIPVYTETIPANNVPKGAMQGLNSSQKATYMGPCPPAGSGTHRYVFELYVLDKTFGLITKPTRENLEKAMAGHILEHCTLTGLFSAS